MSRVFKWSVLLPLLLLLGSIARGEEYGLTIAGVTVTSENCADLSGIGGVTIEGDGKLSYDHTQTTLTMKNVKIEREGETLIKNASVAGLKIVVDGACSLIGKESAAMVLKANTSIEGTGSLSISAPEAYAIYLDNALLTLKALELTVAGDYGLAGDETIGSEGLALENAQLSATGKYGSVFGLSTLTLTKSFLSSPAKAKWDADKHAIVNESGEKLTTEVVFSRIVPYPLQIAGQDVTNANCSNLLGLSNVSGASLSYDPANKILRMKDLSIVAGSENGIKNTGIDGLKVELIGTNNIKTQSEAAIFLGNNTSIVGEGALVLSTESYAAIYISASTTLTIDKASVHAEGTWGVRGASGENEEKLIIKDSECSFKGSEASVAMLEEFSIENCVFAYPRVGHWDAEKHAIVNKDGLPVTETVRVEKYKKYGFTIAGTEVTNTNCEALGSFSGVILGDGGVLSYDPAKKILTAKNVTISSTGTPAINFYELHPMLVIEGECRLNTTNAVALYEATNIEGIGTLYSFAKNRDAIYNHDKYLNVSGVQIVAKATSTTSPNHYTYGIEMQTGLVLENGATVRAKGSYYPVHMYGQKKFRVVYPFNCHFYYGSIRDNHDDLVKNTEVWLGYEYNIRVAGIPVWDGNYKDLSKIEGVTLGGSEGYFNFDPQSNTLRMKDVTVAGSGVSLYVDRSNLKVDVEGDNTIGILQNGQNIELSGAGKLNIVGEWVLKSSAKVNSIALNVGGINGDYRQLSLEDVTLTSNNPQGAIRGIYQLNLRYCYITEPVGGYFSSSQNAVVDANGTIAKQVKITASSGIYIAGMEVTKANAGDLTALAEVSAADGYCKFDYVTNTLKLKNVTITAGDAPAIQNRTDAGLKIEVEGANTLSTENADVLHALKNTTLLGTGSITLRTEAADKEGILFDKAFKILGCSCLVTSGGYGIRGKTLTVDGATVNVTGQQSYVCNLEDLVMTCVQIVEPVGGKWDANRHSIIDTDTNKAKTVILEPQYFTIAGTWVTAANCTDLSAINGVTLGDDGKISYNHSTKTLHLKNVTIDAPIDEYPSISNQDVQGLKILVEGKNILKEYMLLEASTTVVGSTELGYLLLTQDVVLGENSILTIDNNAYLYTKDYIKGFKKEETYSSTLKVTGSGIVKTYRVVQMAVLQYPRISGTWNSSEHQTSEKVLLGGESLNFSIAGYAICDTDLGIPEFLDGISIATGGYFQYDKAEKKLSIKYVTIRGILNTYINDDFGVSQIALAGSNEITEIKTKRHNALILFEKGSLNVIDITLWDDLTIKNGADVKAKLIQGSHSEWDYDNHTYHYYSDLYVINASLTAKLNVIARYSFTGCSLVSGRILRGDNKGSYYSEYNIVVRPDSYKEYGLIIADSRVTSENCEDLSVISGVQLGTDAKFSYDPQTTTLTMKNVSLGDKNIVNEGIAGLKVVVEGENSLYKFIAQENTTWMGNAGNSGKLKARRIDIAEGKTALIQGITYECPDGYDDRAINCGSNSSLTIENATIHINYNGDKIEGNNGASLLLRNATVEGGYIYDFSEFKLEGCYIDKPAGGRWNSSSKRIVDGNGNTQSGILIKPGNVESYDLVIAGTTVTSLNYKKLLEIDGITKGEDAKLDFEPENRNLTLKNVAIDGNIVNLSTSEEAFTINIDGVNKVHSLTLGKKTMLVGWKVNASDKLIIAASSEPLEIPEGGQLTVEHSTISIENGLYLYNTSTLSIQNSVFSVGGAFNARDDEPVSVKINNSTVKAQSLYGFKELVLEGVEYKQPQGAKWDSQKREVVDAQGHRAENVLIAPKGAPTYVAVTSVELSETYIPLTVGTTATVHATVFPKNATNKEVKFTVKDTNVAIIENGNQIRALAQGRTEFRVTTTDGNKTAEGVIEVTNEKIYIETLEFKPAELSIAVGTEMTLKPEISPAKATVRELLWETSAAQIVTVNNGKIKAVAVGNATITVRSKANTDIKATCSITVTSNGGGQVTPPNAVEDPLFVDVRVVPNPFSDVLRIVDVPRTGLHMWYKLLNAQGVVVKQGALPSGDTEIDTADVPQGLYLLQLGTERGTTKVRRLVK